MRKSLLPFIVLITLLGCQKKVNFIKDSEYLEKKEDILYYKGEPLSGVLYSKYENDVVEFEETYVGGELNGPFEGNHDNGQLKEKGTFKEGNRDGPYEEYYSNGQLKEKGTFKVGIKGWI
jgi:antitoxin component YwqK of YwqJK toxin-antitoxin module